MNYNFVKISVQVLGALRFLFKLPKFECEEKLDGSSVKLVKDCKIKEELFPPQFPKIFLQTGTRGKHIYKNFKKCKKL